MAPKDKKIAAASKEEEIEPPKPAHIPPKADGNPKSRKPTVTGSKFAKEFELILKEKYDIDANASKILSALFDAIKSTTKKLSKMQKKTEG
jgi:hypothetical protein